MELYIMVDFGSTYTKVTAIDVEGEVLLGRAQSPTTIDTDITVGLNKALANLEQQCGVKVSEAKDMFACSSAAGGLKMAAVGLVPALTLEAARRAALGAGAKVTGAYGYELGEDTVAEIEAQGCDIILLCGGTDGGNQKVILHNAKMLAASAITCPILVCGNRSVTAQVKATLEAGGKQVYTASNVLPAIDQVDVEPAQSQIREIFIAHIVKAKGLDRAREFFGRDIIPTPKASLRAAELLAAGTEKEKGLGDLLIVEVGGATTNIHSVAALKPVTSQTIVRGLPEQRIKRTVEGDLGIRFNARTIYDFVGGDVLAMLVQRLEPEVECTAEQADAYTKLLSAQPEHTPENRREALLDVALALSAVSMATQRHAGTVKSEYSVVGELQIQYGKNLLEVNSLIGTGGIFKYGARPEDVLKAAMFDPGNPWSLRPRAPAGYVDSDYILYAVGLLSQAFPDQALRVAKKYLRPTGLEAAQEVDG